MLNGPHKSIDPSSSFGENQSPREVAHRIRFLSHPRRRRMYCGWASAYSVKHDHPEPVAGMGSVGSDGFSSQATRRALRQCGKQYGRLVDG